MVELKLRNIMKQLTSSDPSKRFEALDKLNDFKQDEGLEVQIEVLKDMIVLATKPFPEPVDIWDNPSYYLIDFVCDFPMEEVIEGLLKHFDGFHLHAKERVIEFLLGTEDEKIFYELEDKINQLIQTELVSLPVPELANYPLLIKGIFEKNFDLIRTEHYKYMFYDLLLALNSSGFEQNYKSDIVLPLLIEDYQQIKQQYNPYNSDYKVSYVYKSWGESYFKIRFRMRLFLSLMEYYFTEGTEKELLDALTFKDPLIKTEALLVCLEKNLSLDKSLVEECANDIESAEMLYWALHEKNKTHLYPIKENKQVHLAKTRLFSYITNLPVEEDEPDKLPDDIKVLDSVETENAYGQPIRYYLMSFRESDTTYVAWVGGYAIEDGDDTAHLWDGTYSDFVELASLSIDEHKKKFFEDREEGKQQYESFIHYESSPRLSKGLWFLYGLAIMQWVRALLAGFVTDSLILPLIISAVAGILTLIEKQKIKSSKISIIGRELVLVKGKSEQIVPLTEIKKVEYTKKHISITDKQNKMVMKFPMNWVHYGQFYVHMKEHTSHLKEIPYIEE